MAGSTRVQQTQALQARIADVERPGRAAGEGISSGCPALDRLLPGRGFSPGTLVEWLAAGSGAASLALWIARQACAEGGRLVVIDRRRRFYPPAAAALGLDLAQLVLVQPDSQRDEHWALDQALRSEAVTAVWGWFAALDERTMRRLQLAAKQADTLGLLLRPAAVRGQPTWAESRLLVEPVPSRGDPQWRVKLVRQRGAAAGGECRVQWNTESGTLREVAKHETYPVRLVPQLANPASAGRAAGA